MGSTRFPEKMLAKLGGFPILEWVLRRVKHSTKVDQVVLATSTLPQNDVLVDLAEKYNVNVFRGSEDDVLKRFVDASKLYNADWVVRICADNPFVAPEEIDRLIEHFKITECDYACNHQDHLGSGYADGFGAEIMNVSALQKLQQTVIDSQEREHVTLHLWNNLDQFDLSVVIAPEELTYPDLKFDVDTIEDFNKLELLCKKGIDFDSKPRTIIQTLLLTTSRINYH
jgi:spore coat polysaccharide biosynthesis protein SpsF